MSLILDVPLSLRRPDDVCVWFPDAKGVYSVRSGYGVLHREASYDQSVDDTLVWKCLWKFHAPPKIKIFMWRATRGYLPMREALYRCHVLVEVHCQFCHTEIETKLHLLVACRFAQDVWRKFGLGFFLGGSTSFKD